MVGVLLGHVAGWQKPRPIAPSKMSGPVPIPLPALCRNPFCRLAFFIPFPLGAGSAIFENCQTDCPRCKEMADIRNGTYTVFDAASWRGADVTVLERAIGFLSTRLQHNRPPEVVRTEASSVAPELQSLWDLLPKKRTELYAMLALLTAILTFIMTCIRDARKSDTKLSLPPEFIKALSDSGKSVQSVSQRDNRKGRSARSKRDKGQSGQGKKSPKSLR